MGTICRRQLSARELDSILACADLHTTNGLRDSALLSLMADTGLPCEVLLHADATDVIAPGEARQLRLPAAWYLRHPSAGRRAVHCVFRLQARTGHSLSLWDQHRTRMCLDKRPFFCRLGTDCLRDGGESLKPESVREIVRELAARAGIGGPVTPGMIAGVPTRYDLRRPRKPLMAA